MPEECPSPSALAEYAAGWLGEEEALALQSHLGACLACAKALDEITGAQLAELGASCLAAPDPHSASPLVQRLMDQARAGDLEPRGRGGGGGSAAELLSALDPATAPGTRGKFAGYDVLDVAGEGGMGIVLKAHDPTLHRTVAIKVLAPNRAWDEASVEASVERFLREARTIAALQHDHVVTVHAAGREKGLPYLVMPFHAGGTLAQWLQHTPRLAPPEVIGVGIQIASALESTHARGVLHRDIKPSNVLLEGGLERVRLADFGLAQPLRGAGESPSHRPVVAGTPQYMSPEQARGEPCDARSDVFGLGALLFQLATGRTIHAGAEAKEVLAAATQARPMPVRKANPDVPAALAAAIDRMLAVRPEDRFASAAAAAAALTRLARPPSRRLAWLRRAALIGLTAATGVVALDWTGRTAVVNMLLCLQSGDGFFVRGKFGTYAALSEAVAACRGGEVIEARFSGERVTGGVRVGAKALTIRAAAGFAPALLATNSTQPLLLADGPLTLEGLTLWRRSERFNFSPLISVENAPLHLLNCRLGRAPLQGEDVLVRAGRRVGSEEPPRFYRPLVVLSSGGSAHLRNCLLLGAQASGVGMRGLTPEPLQVEVENSLFVVQRSFVVRADLGTTVQLTGTRSVFVSGALVDLEDAEPLGRFAASWADCLVDHKQGALLQMNRLRPADRLRAIDWQETNVVYSGPGTFLADRRRRRVDSDSEWTRMMRLPPGGHRLNTGDIFSRTRVRSSQRFSAIDVALESGSAPGGHLGFSAAWIGEGAAFATFRRAPEYQRWQGQVHASVRQWEQRRAAPGSAGR